MKTKLGRIYRDLIQKHFTPNHVLYKIFNKNTLKLSYSCLPNMKAVLDAHNRAILRVSVTTDDKNCNCRRAVECPLEGKCLTKNVIYQADISSVGENKAPTKSYIGSTARTFKERFNDHKSSFRNGKGGSKLAKYITNLKEKNQKFNIKWKIINQSKQTAPNLKICTLCNLERMEIALAEKRNLLNSRNELVTKCPHSRRLFF